MQYDAIEQPNPEIWLELDDGKTVHLKRGDVVVQNGSRHAWLKSNTNHSYRSVVVGSSPAARRAGIRHATSATAIRRIGATRKVTASDGLIP